MLVGLSQQTTPMTTRLKFHGKLHELECALSLALSFSLPLFLPSLTLSLSLSPNRFYMIPLSPWLAPIVRLPFHSIPVARLSSHGSATPSSLSGDWYATAATPAF